MLSERAVSPVIGVILMVAVTVILSATIAGFIIFGDEIADDVGGNAPQANFDYDPDEEVLVHRGGDELDPDTLVVDGERLSENQFSEGETIVAGDEISMSPGEELIWEDPESDETQILYTAPD